jgi:hypothetical protein
VHEFVVAAEDPGQLTASQLVAEPLGCMRNVADVDVGSTGVA